MPHNTSKLFTPFQKLIIGTCIIIIAIAAFNSIKHIITPFLTALIISYLLTPVVDRMESLFRSRVISTITVLILLGTGIGFLFSTLVPLITNEFNDLSRALPNYIANLKDIITSWKSELETQYPILAQLGIADNIQTQLQQWILSITTILPNIFKSTFSIFTYILIVPISLYFFLVDGPSIRKNLLKLVPNKYFEMSMHTLSNISTKLGNYLRGILLETAIIAGLISILLFFINIDYSLILGIVAGIANIIPYLGPIVGAIPALFIALFQLGSINPLLSVVIVFTIVQLLDNIFLKPIIYSQSVDLHPIIILFSLFVGGVIAGVWGLLLAIPVAGIIKVVAAVIFKEAQFRLQHIKETYDEN